MAIAAAAGAWIAANAGAISAVTAAGSAMMQGIQARNAAQAAETQRKQKNASALNSMQDQYSQLSGAEKDSRQRAVEESMANQREYASRRSKISLMAAASGTSGLSVDSMVRDLRQQRGRNMNTIITNQDIELQGFRNQAEQIRVGTAARTDNRKIQRPSWAEVGLQTGIAGVQGLAEGKDIQESLGYGGDPAATLKGGT